MTDPEPLEIDPVTTVATTTAPGHDRTVPVPAIPDVPDAFGVVFPDGAWFDCTQAARLFDQDPEDRARRVAAKIGGRAVRIRTQLVDVAR